MQINQDLKAIQEFMHNTPEQERAAIRMVRDGDRLTVHFVFKNGHTLTTAGSPPEAVLKEAHEKLLEFYAA